MHHQSHTSPGKSEVLYAKIGLTFCISQERELLRGCARAQVLFYTPSHHCWGLGGQKELSHFWEGCSFWSGENAARAELVSSQHSMLFLCLLPLVINIAAVPVSFPIPLVFKVNCAYLNLWSLAFVLSIGGEGGVSSSSMVWTGVLD